MSKQSTTAVDQLPARIEKAKEFIAANFLRNPGLTDIAAAVGLSPFHFHRTFTKVTGQTPKDYVDQFRIDEAKRRMLAGAPLNAIAADLKFSHQSHFTSRFKQLVGEAPGRWVRQHAA
jgi:AraC-like DNA-binding protein